MAEPAPCGQADTTQEQPAHLHPTKRVAGGGQGPPPGPALHFQAWRVRRSVASPRRNRAPPRRGRAAAVEATDRPCFRQAGSASPIWSPGGGARTRGACPARTESIDKSRGRRIESRRRHRCARMRAPRSPQDLGCPPSLGSRFGLPQRSPIWRDEERFRSLTHWWLGDLEAEGAQPALCVRNRTSSGSSCAT